jgi:PAS domain S-box-containing protein
MQPPVFYILLLLTSVALGIFMALYVARRGSIPGASALVALILAATLWALGYALEIQFLIFRNMLFWARIQYLGIALIPAAWLVFVGQYLGSSGWLAGLIRRPWLLAIEPIITLLLVWTNEAHGLVWEEVKLGGPFNTLALVHGPWFWAHLIYSYALLLVGAIYLVRGLLRSVRLHRWQIRLALLATFIPWFGNLVYVSSWNPVPGLDWTPLFFILSGLFLGLSLYRFHLVSLQPIAHQRVFAGLGDSLLVLDPHNYIVDLNQAAEKIIGHRAEKPLGRRVDEVLPGLLPWLEQAGSRSSFQAEAVLEDGPESRIYDLRLTALQGSSPHVSGRLVLLHEITQLKQGQVLAEKRFQQLVEAAPDALLLIDPDGTILLANAQAERLFGCPAAELAERPVTDLLLPGSWSGFEQRLQRLLAGETPSPDAPAWECSALRADGAPFPAEISLGSLGTAEGVWVACTVRDITQRNAAEAALQESMHTYQALFENAGDAIFLISLDGILIQANQTAAGLLGYSRQELQSLPLASIVLPEEYPDVEQKMKLLLSGQTIPPYVRRYCTRTGAVVRAEMNMVLVSDSGGSPLFFQSMGRDISMRLRTEQAQARMLEEIGRSREQLQALTIRLQEVREAERRQLSAELHDRVGQNLTGLNLNLQIVQNQLGPEADPALRQRLDDSLHLVEETTRKVRDVMADLHSPLLDEYGLVSALKWYASRFSERTGIAAHFNGDEFSPRLPARDETVLFRLVQEALNNVAKHARARRVHIRVGCSPPVCRLCVEDDGDGFDPHILNGPGGQPHWGLVAMQQQVVSLGGQLTIDSAPGAGTRLTVQFERQPDAHSCPPG